MGLEATTWNYFHRFAEISNVSCSICSKSYPKEYRPFFNIGGDLVCYFCVKENTTLPYPVHINYPDINESKSWKPIIEDYKYK